MTWQHAIRRFLRWLELSRGRSDHTIRAYRADLEGLAAYCQAAGVGRAEDATRDDVRGWLAGMTRDGRARSTVARKLHAARSFYAWLADRGEVDGNAAADVATPKVARALPRPLTEAQAAAVLDTPDRSTPAGLRDAAVLELLYGSGVRCAEAAGLDLDDVDPAAGWAYVVGKGDAERKVPLSRPCATALGDYLEHARPALTGPVDTQAVFLGSRDGRRIGVRDVYDVVARAGRAAGIDDVHPHRLRSSCATHMLDGGADLASISHLLGHAHLHTTAASYVKVSPRLLHATYDDAFPRA